MFLLQQEQWHVSYLYYHRQAFLHVLSFNSLTCAVGMLRQTQDSKFMHVTKMRKHPRLTLFKGEALIVDQT